MGYFLGAFFFYASKLLAPLHVPIAIILLYLGVRTLYRIYRKRRVQAGLALVTHKTWKQLVLYKIFAITVVGLALFGYAFVSLVPTDKAVFTELSPEEINRVIVSDLTQSAQLVDMLTVTGDTLLNNVALYKADLTVDDQELLKKQWNAFLGVALASEAVTDVHRYFPQISLLEHPELQAQSFTISYALYMLKFEYFHRIIDAVGANTEARTVLNEYSSAFGARGSYTDVSDRFFAANSLLRRTMGYVYYLLMAPSSDAVLSPEYKILLNVAKNSQTYLAKNMLSHLTHRSVAYTNAFNDGVSETWLPIQKTVFVDMIGNVHVGDRASKFITVDDIATMKASLKPGDIFVARKNWYASNVGIPGFWTHAGLYTGTLPDMREYFAELFPYIHNGVSYESFDALMLAVVPQAFGAYQSPDANGYAASVIESETRGTGINAIEYSAHVDYFGVMRPKLEKSDVLRSLLRAFAHYQKPYDYTFNLTTKDEIFCSELVYDAYIPMRDKKGIQLPTAVVSGMELVAPNDIVRKFTEERGTEHEELSFAYFLDGNEKTLRANAATEEAFRASFLRPKFSVLQE
jgi:Permuted papain-like amidase enzyme, YaeF/YiiX, C92 family